MLSGFTVRRTSPTLVPAIQAMNARMEGGGSGWKFYAKSDLEWLGGCGAGISRELYVAERGGEVCGGFVLKRQPFLLDGEPVAVGNVQGPVSESLVRPELRGLGGYMMGQAVQMEPLTIGWGSSDQKAKMLARMGWQSTRVPILLRLVKPGRVFRKGRMLKSPPLAALVRLAALLGVPQVAFAYRQSAHPDLSPPSAQAVVVPHFGAWADPIWEAAKGRYGLIAERGAKALNRVMPAGEWPDVTVLRIDVDGSPIGWAAVRDRQLDGDPTFGSLRVGSIVDALARPGQESIVAWTATKWLAKQGVDAIGAVFTHKDWREAFKRAGYLTLRNRRHVAASPALTERTGDLSPLLDRAHLTLMDGDGPRLF